MFTSCKEEGIESQRDILLENKGLHDINPLQCGEEDCDPGHTFGPFVRTFYLLHYVLSGEGEYRSPRGTYKVAEGQIFVIRPGEVTTYAADLKNPWHYCWIGFECGLPLGDTLGRDVINAPECMHIFYSLLESGHIETGREWYICGKIYELLAMLGSGAGPERERARHYVKMAQNYIETHFDRELRVDKLAASLNLDRAYFSKIFRRYTGKPPQRYIVDLRLDKAAELLARQGLAPGEVAQRVGYGDIFNFSRMFHRRFGVPPSAYQRDAGPNTRLG